MLIPAALAPEFQAGVSNLEQEFVIGLRIDLDVLFARLRIVYQDGTILLIVIHKIKPSLWPLALLFAWHALAPSFTPSLRVLITMVAG
jgi:hypothetical protein